MKLRKKGTQLIKKKKKKNATCTSPSKLGNEDKLLNLKIRNTHFRITTLGYWFR